MCPGGRWQLRRVRDVAGRRLQAGLRLGGVTGRGAALDRVVDEEHKQS